MNAPITTPTYVSYESLYDEVDAVLIAKELSLIIGFEPKEIGSGISLDLAKPIDDTINAHAKHRGFHSHYTYVGDLVQCLGEKEPEYWRMRAELTEQFDILRDFEPYDMLGWNYGCYDCHSPIKTLVYDYARTKHREITHTLAIAIAIVINAYPHWYEAKVKEKVG